MSKIEDIAREYVEERRDLDVGHANCQFNCFHMEDAVKFGANAVLEEIEKCYEKDDSLCAISHKIISKIQQLKGE